MKYVVSCGYCHFLFFPYVLLDEAKPLSNNAFLEEKEESVSSIL